MPIRHWRDVMQHVDEGQLAAYVDGALSDAERAVVDAHLTECAECRRQLDEARRVADAARAILATPMAGAPTFDDVLARAGRRRGRWYRPLMWAASVALVAGLSWYSLRPGEVSPAAHEQVAAT